MPKSMTEKEAAMNKLTFTALTLVTAIITGCASFDHQDEFILGEATQANIALQSIRDTDQPNTALVEGQSGERAVAAVQRLNDGETTPLQDVKTSGVDDS